MCLSLSAAAQAQLLLMETLHSSFERHASRLAVVRESKRKKEEAILGVYRGCRPLFPSPSPPFTPSPPSPPHCRWELCS